MSPIIEQYIEKVKKELYSLVPSDDFISDLRSNLEEHILEFPDSTYDDLVEQFGTPETVAKDFLSANISNEPKEQARHQKRKRLTIILVSAVIVFLLIMVILLSGSRQAYYTDTTTIIETEILSE